MVRELQLVLYDYYSKMSASLSIGVVTVQTLGLLRTHENILLAHLVYKCIVKMAVWLWNRIDKVSKDELERNRAWVSPLLYADHTPLTFFYLQLHDLFRNSAIQLKALTELRQALLLSLTRSGLAVDQPTRRSVDILTRHIRLFGKFFRRLQQLSQARFVELPTCSELILFYWSQVDEATCGPPDLIAGENFHNPTYVH